MASNSNSAIYSKNINKFSKPPKSLTTILSSFDGKSMNFELFDEFLQTSFENTGDDKIIFFSSHALPTFQNINTPTQNYSCTPYGNT